MKPNRNRLIVVVLLTVIGLLVAACQSAPSAEPVLTVGDSQPTAVAPTAPPAATSAAPATALPAPVVVEATAVVDSAESTPLPDPTAAPVSGEPLPGQIGPTFAPGVNPFTGETMADPAALDRRPLAIKISNYPPVVRPQSGLNNADLAFEHYAEGGVTRFTAIFYGQDADPVGSIRSGRLIDLELPKMYDAAFAYSGASGPVRLKFAESPFFDRVISPDFGHDGFYRVNLPDRAFEHTLFTDTFFLRNILTNRGLNTAPQLQNGMVFTAEPLAGGVPVRAIDVAYIGANAYWSYNPATGRYARATDGVALVDANTNQPVTFKNVVVLAANHVDTLILEDSLGNRSIEIQVWGEGPVSIFRDGVRFDGRWLRADPLDMFTFVDEAGNPLPLGVGNTFFQVVPLGFTGLTTTE